MMPGMFLLARAALFGLAALVAFALIGPSIIHFGASLGPWTITVLLAIGTALSARPSIAAESRTQPIPRSAFPRIAASGIIGSLLGPAALAWGCTPTVTGLTFLPPLAFVLGIMLLEAGVQIGKNIAGADPNAVTVVKCTLAIVLAVILAIVSHEPLPNAFNGIALILTGAVSFGVSPRWFASARAAYGQALASRKPS